MFPISFAMVAAAWELYKAIGPEDGASLLGVRLLPRTSDLAMPHVWDMVQRVSEPEVRGGSKSVFRVVASATWYSFGTALAAFVIGSLLGIVLAVLMARFKVLERAFMPYIVLSQTVPIIVLGPLIMSLIGYASRDWATDYWAGAIILGVFLAFFPVA
ncbi:MAG: ABC transporter permease subunit, partial [Actinobacteria bacterium]|nr:ABC transporter permease subunit [Actinomycetota bacterium]